MTNDTHATKRTSLVASLPWALRKSYSSSVSPQAARHGQEPSTVLQADPRVLTDCENRGPSLGTSSADGFGNHLHGAAILMPHYTSTQTIEINWGRATRTLRLEQEEVGQLDGIHSPSLVLSLLFQRCQDATQMMPRCSQQGQNGTQLGVSSTQGLRAASPAQGSSQPEGPTHDAAGPGALDSGGARWAHPAAPPPDPSPLTSPRAPHSPWRRGRAPPPWPPPCCAPPQLSQPGARGRGSLPFSLPLSSREEIGGGSGGAGAGPAPSRGRRGWRGARRLLRAAGGGRTRQAASPLKAATTSPARGRSAHAPRACAPLPGSASRLPPAQARCGLLRFWLCGSPREAGDRGHRGLRAGVLLGHLQGGVGMEARSLTWVMSSDDCLWLASWRPQGLWWHSVAARPSASWR